MEKRRQAWNKCGKERCGITDGEDRKLRKNFNFEMSLRHPREMFRGWLNICLSLKGEARSRNG